MSKITKIHAREILDSRGNPTVEADVYLESGATACSAAPSGASTGSKEALELRDGDKKRFLGKGVLKAVANVNKIIAKALVGQESGDQKEIDRIMIELDGTPNKSKLGANAILAVSMAVLKAVAYDANMPLFAHIAEKFDGKSGGKYLMPVPMMNIINGGAHADNSADIQEFMIMPIGAKNFREAVRMGAETFHNLKKILKEKKHSVNVGDEGGFAPTLSSNKEALEAIMSAIGSAGYKAGKDISIALDSAASEFYENGKYVLKKDGLELTGAEMVGYYEKLVSQYPIISIEDGLAEDDWENWKLLNKKLGKKIQIVGDDIFVTNPEIIKRGIKEKAANAVLIKVNQIGTVSETVEAVKMAQSAGWGTIISHRSGETDEFIEPCVLPMAEGKTCEVMAHDAMIFFNFRADRARQLAKKFSEECHAEDFTYITMTDYGESLPKNALFGGEKIADNLAEIISKNGLKQFHIAETEKFAHATYFFNGGKEEPYAGEDRKLIASNKIATHDLAPEMKAKEIMDEIITAVKNGEYNFILANFANMDMVGHTGKIEETITAAETIDSNLGRIIKEIEKSDYVLIITADHGNAEKMFDSKINQPHTAHTENPVPFAVMKKGLKLSGRGRLCDIAPTILEIMGIDKPKAMTGVSLIEK